MEKAMLMVKGMSCDHCVRSIKENVGKLEGVKQVDVHLREGKVDVEFDSHTVSLGKITETIEDQGYDVA